MSRAASSLRSPWVFSRRCRWALRPSPRSSRASRCGSTRWEPGGGYDAYMRALIPHLEQKLGAKMLPTNEPGAGGLIAINRTLHAPADGLTILLVGGETLVTAQLYDAPGVNYDVPKLTWLARVSSE